MEFESGAVRDGSDFRIRYDAPDRCWLAFRGSGYALTVCRLAVSAPELRRDPSQEFYLEEVVS
jgi:hypothetical protein